MKLGIVGLPNVGKSTLFNAITNAGVPADNYAFCTIDPNVGVVAVPDKRLTELTKLYDAVKTPPAVIEFVDIAGLVKGASKGEGLGNQFLANIREVDAIILTGGIAHSKYVTESISERCRFIAPIEVYAGENELQALAVNALRVLDGLTEAKIYE